MKCRYCQRNNKLNREARDRIRAFLTIYPWVTQKDVAALFELSQARMSEIIRGDKSRGGL